MSGRPDIIDWSALDPAQRERLLQRPAQATSAEVQASVASIIDQVRGQGDAALRALTLQLDGVALDDFAVGDAEFAAAEAAVSLELRVAMIAAAQRIEAFHEDGMLQPYAVETAPGVVCERILRAIGRVGLYVPAGSAPLPSTALMLGVPATGPQGWPPFAHF